MVRGGVRTLREGASPAVGPRGRADQRRAGSAPGIPAQLELHAAAVLAADLEQRVRDLPERADAHRVHQHLENVLIAYDCLAQALKHGAAFLVVLLVELAQARELRALLFLGGADQL